MIHPFQIYNKSSLIYIIFWVIVISLHSTVFYFVLNVDLQTSILDAFIYNLNISIILYSIWYFISSFGTEKNLISLLITNLLVCIIMVLVWLYFSSVISSLIVPKSSNSSYNDITSKAHLIRGIIGVFYYGVVISAYYVYIIYQDFSKKKLREKELNKLLTESELKTLKYQINPHFIFNTLNSISSLTIISPEKAREMTIRLSDFMRSTFSKKDEKFIRFKDELDSIKNYMEIEKIRFEDKFEFSENVSPNCQNVMIPNFILQPIIENAIKHGVYESLNKVIIKLSCEIKENFVEIKISNNYEESSVNGEGVGLTNVKERLKLIYGNDLLLRIEDKDHVFTASIFIPIERENDKNNNY